MLSIFVLEYVCIYLYIFNQQVRLKKKEEEENTIFPLCPTKSYSLEKIHEKLVL